MFLFSMRTGPTNFPSLAGFLTLVLLPLAIRYVGMGVLLGLDPPVAGWEDVEGSSFASSARVLGFGFWGETWEEGGGGKTNTDVDGEIDNFMPLPHSHPPVLGETKMLVKSHLIFPNPSVTLPNPVFLSLA